jgi:hypothetical protein
MPDGTQQQPGGWNRFAVEVSDLAGTVEKLRQAGVRFRNELVTGIGASRFLLRTLQVILLNSLRLSSQRLASILRGPQCNKKESWI